MPKLPKFLEVKEDDTEEEKKKKRFLLILFIILFFLVFVGILLGIIFGVRSCTKSREGGNPTTAPTSGSITQTSSSEPVVTEYLNYALNDDGLSYKVTGAKSGHPEDIVIPDTYEGKPVTVIDHHAFWDDQNVKTVVMTDNITFLGTLCFHECENLVSVDLSENLVGTETGCFAGCTSLKTISLPNTLVDASCDIFANCPALESVEYGNAKYIGNDENPYMFLLETQIKNMTSFEIKEGCRYVADLSFKDWTSLTTITIPETVLKIGIECFKNSGISTINLPSNLKSIQQKAFEECLNLTSIVIPDTVVELGSQTFNRCENLTNVQLGKGLTQLDSGMFEYCTSLPSLSIPKNITLIDMFAFNNCSSLTALDYEGTVEEWGQIELWEDWAKYSSLTVVHCIDGDVPVVTE